MFKKIISIAAAAGLVLTLAPAAQADQILVNFGDTAYTSDGSNTWQTFDLVAANTIPGNSGTVGTSETWVNSGLLTAGPVSIPSEINLDVTGVVTKNLSTGPWNGLLDNAGALTQAS